MQTLRFGRRIVLWSVGMLVCGSVGHLLSLIGHMVPAAAAQERPNIVLIMADDMGYETVGAYGGTSYWTPALDQLAATGMRFEHTHTQPLCSPSRVQIMTGKYNFRNYIRWGHLAQGERTFAHVLQDAGYWTMVAGKWQLALKGGQTPTDAGFDEYMIHPPTDRYSRYWGPTFDTNGELRTYDSTLFGPDLLTDYINSFLEHHQDRPFFVYYSMALAHDPYVATPDAPGATTPQERRIAMVEYADKMVAKVISKLAVLDLREKTLVLFTGDNGSPILVPKNIKTENGTIDRIWGGKGV